MWGGGVWLGWGGRWGVTSLDLCFTRPLTAPAFLHLWDPVGSPRKLVFVGGSFLPIRSAVAVTALPFFVTAPFSSPSKHFLSFVTTCSFVLTHLRAVSPTSLMTFPLVQCGQVAKDSSEESDKLGSQSWLTAYWMCDQGKLPTFCEPQFPYLSNGVRIMPSWKPAYEGEL